MQLPPGCAAKFAPERPLSEGGFGAVYLARQVGLDRPVALKLLHAAMASDAGQVDRFLDEARITAALTHPHIVVVIDHGVDDGVPWIAYELLPGRSLHDTIASAPLAWTAAATAGAQVASALAAAHAAGVLHRDIKPHNVLESAPGHWKVTDFGIAKWTQTTRVKTVTGMVIGTPPYLAPELLAGDAASPASDLYALGALLFEAVAGEPPFTGDNPLDVLRARAVMDAPPLATRAQVPRAFAAIVDGLLARDPAKRPGTAEQVVERLRGVLAGADEGAPLPAASGPGRVTGRSAALSRDTGRTAALRPPRTVAATVAVARPASRRWPWVLGGLAALLAWVASTYTTGPHIGPVPLPSTPARQPIDASKTIDEIRAGLGRLPPVRKFAENSAAGIFRRAAAESANPSQALLPDLEEARADYAKRAQVLAELVARLDALDRAGSGPRVRLLAARAMVRSEVVCAWKFESVCRQAHELLQHGMQWGTASDELSSLNLQHGVVFEDSGEVPLGAFFADAGAALDALGRDPDHADDGSGRVLSELGWIASHLKDYKWADPRVWARIDRQRIARLTPQDTPLPDAFTVARLGWTASSNGKPWSRDPALVAAYERLERVLPPAARAGLAHTRQRRF